MTGAANGQPFNLDAAAKAAAAEANPFVFTYKGKTYTVPPTTEWQLEAQRLIGKGDIEAAMPMLLGEAYEGLVQSGLTLGELQTLFEAIGKHAGVDNLPNSRQPALPGSTRT